jgi:SAM-dependent methyltransferase
MPSDVRSAEAKDGCRDKTAEAKADCSEKRLSQEVKYTDRPSSFVSEWARAIAPRVRAPHRALDVAMGRGRHAVALATAGFDVFGVDVDFAAVRDAMVRAARLGLTVHGWCANLTEYPLPTERFELVVVARYLQRDLFPALRDAVVPGGALIYETFTEGQRALGRGPTSAEHLLAPGELRERLEGFEVLCYEEVLQPDALARFVGIKP